MQIKTFKGHAIGQLPEIDVEDIAHCLSNLCLFHGHTKRFISYAEYSAHMAGRIKESNYKLYALTFNAWRCFEFTYTSTEQMVRMQNHILRKLDLSPQFMSILAANLNQMEKELGELLHKRFVLGEEPEEEEQQIEYGMMPEQAKELFLKMWKKYR